MRKPIKKVPKNNRSTAKVLFHPTMTTTTSVPSESNSSKQDPKINNLNNNSTTTNITTSNTVNTNTITTTAISISSNIMESTPTTNCPAITTATLNPSAITINTSATQRAVTITPIINSTLNNLQNFSRTMQTDEDFNIRFVNLVRNHKCLYDKKVPEYRNRDNQEKAWLQISIETKESGKYDSMYMDILNGN